MENQMEQRVKEETLELACGYAAENGLCKLLALDLRDTLAALKASEEAREETKKALEHACDPELVRMEIESGKIDMTLRGEAVVMQLAECFYSMMETAGAKNVLEIGIQHRIAGDIHVTLQKTEGKTPMGLVEDAKAETVAAQAEIARLREALEYFADPAKWEPQPAGFGRTVMVPWSKRARNVLSPAVTQQAGGDQ